MGRKKKSLSPRVWHNSPPKIKKMVPQGFFFRGKPSPATHLQLVRSFLHFPSLPCITLSAASCRRPGRPVRRDDGRLHASRSSVASHRSCLSLLRPWPAAGLVRSRAPPEARHVTSWNRPRSQHTAMSSRTFRSYQQWMLDHSTSRQQDLHASSSMHLFAGQEQRRGKYGLDACSLGPHICALG
jgi:hypothetical protein